MCTPSIKPARALPHSLVTSGAPVKRGAGGLPSFPLRSSFSNFSELFILMTRPICYRSWAFCSWTLLKLLTMLRKVKIHKKRGLNLFLYCGSHFYDKRTLIQNRVTVNGDITCMELAWQTDAKADWFPIFFWICLEHFSGFFNWNEVRTLFLGLTGIFPDFLRLFQIF